MPEPNDFHTAVERFRRSLLEALSKSDKAIVEISFSAGPEWLVTIKKNAAKKRTKPTAQKLSAAAS